MNGDPDEWLTPVTIGLGCFSLAMYVLWFLLLLGLVLVVFGVIDEPW